MSSKTLSNKEKTKSNPCEWCEGKGYDQLQSCYDEIHSRIECTYCMGEGVEIEVAV